MAAPLQLKDVIKGKVADAVRRHVNVDTIAEEIASAMADQIEARAQDRVADLRAQLEQGRHG
jgi:hypothetical protein